MKKQDPFAAKKAIKGNLTDIRVTGIDGIDHSDYPKFTDAFVVSAYWKSTEKDLTESELDELNENHSDFVYESTQDWIY